MAGEGMLYMLIIPGDPGFKVSKDKKREKIHGSFGKYILICFPACPSPQRGHIRSRMILILSPFLSSFPASLSKLYPSKTQIYRYTKARKLPRFKASKSKRSPTVLAPMLEIACFRNPSWRRCFRDKYVFCPNPFSFLIRNENGRPQEIYP